MYVCMYVCMYVFIPGLLPIKLPAVAVRQLMEDADAGSIIHSYFIYMYYVCMYVCMYLNNTYPALVCPKESC